MTINHFDGKDNGFWGVRVTVRPKEGSRKQIQRWFSYRGTTSDEERHRILLNAEECNNQLRKKYKALTDEEIQSQPFRAGQKGVKGTSPSKIRGLILVVPSKRRKGSKDPDWFVTDGVCYFASQAPYFAVHLPTTRPDIKAKGLPATKRFTIRNSKSYKQAYCDAIDYLILSRPEYEPHRKSMIESMPSWEESLAFAIENHIRLWGKKPQI